MSQFDMMCDGMALVCAGEFPGAIYGDGIPVRHCVTLGFTMDKEIVELRSLIGLMQWERAVDG